MVVSEAIRKEIEEKVKLYDAAKEEVKARIEKEINKVLERAKKVGSELIDEVDKEFGKNPFAEFLCYANSRTDADAKKLLAEQKILKNFGPDEESFSILQQAIDSLKAWRNFIPKKLKVENTTWDSITLTWDKIDDASSYQIEVDGSISCDTSTTNSFTKMGLLPETEHGFRVRTVKESSVSEWSGVVKGRTLKWDCVWKKCPDYVDKKRKYSVDGGNPRIATKVNSDFGGCTIIGNTHIPLNKVASWSIKVLKSKYNDRGGIYIGVALNDINQNNNNNDIKFFERGWYFDCYQSALCSGSPHNYYFKEYGPRKEKGEYVHTGDSVGVVVDTTKGELSFVLNGVNLGVAYDGIPLDKPLVPCVILTFEGDSVELVT